MRLVRNSFRVWRLGRRFQHSKAPIDIPAPLWHKRLGPVTDFFGWFHKTSTNRPYTVQLSTSAVIYLCGDLLAQEVGGEPYNGYRTLRTLTIGIVSSIPGYKWYWRTLRPYRSEQADQDRFLFLGNHFNYASQWKSILVKVCVQQAVFSPVFNTYFFSMQAILTGESPSGVIARLKETVPRSITNSVKIWPIITACSFLFIGPQYRFMFSGVFAVCWQTYLSLLNRSAELSKQK